MCAVYMTTQQSGMQQTQQSNPPQSQSRHLVLPGAVPPGLIELVAEPGRTKLTGLEVGSVHMAFEGNEGRQGGRQWAFRGTVRDAQTLLNNCSRHVPLFLYIYTERCGPQRLSSCSTGFGNWAKRQGTTCDAPHLMYLLVRGCRSQLP